MTMQIRIGQRFALVAAVLIIGAVCASCTSNEAAQTATPVEGSETQDLSASTAPTPTPQPTSTPAPTPTATPVPEPIFTQVELPAGMVSEPQRSLFDAAPPTGPFGWVGAGRDYQATVAGSVPIVWSVDTTSVFTHSYLPLPESIRAGGASFATVINGVQVIGGYLRDTSVATRPTEPLLWSRDDPAGEWLIDRLDFVDLPGIEHGNSSVWELAGSDTWGLISVGFVSHEEDDEGERQRQRYLAATSDGHNWSPVNLPGIDNQNWALDIYISGDQGLVVATSTDADQPAKTLFTTGDSGASWQASEVAFVGDDAPSVVNAYWDSAWILVGSMSSGEGESTPAVFTRSLDRTWSGQPIELDVGDATAAITTDGSFVPFSDYEFATVHRLDDARFVALFNTNSGTLAATSTDLVAWKLDPKLQLNGTGYSYFKDSARGLVADSRRDRLLAIRGFEPPVWMSTSRTRAALTDAFDSARSSRTALISHQDTFVWLATTDANRFRTRRWQSTDGLEWTPVGDQLAFRPTLTSSTGDAIYIYGDNYDFDSLVRIVTDGDGFEFSVRTLSSLPVDTDLRRVNLIPPNASTNGRNMLAHSWAPSNDGRFETYISFVDLDTPELLTTYLAPSVGDAPVRIMCPQLDSGESVIVFDVVDEIGTIIEVWADRDEPRLGEGLFSSEAGRDVITVDCGRLSEGLVLTGTSCPDHLSSWNADECEPRLWISADGLIWHQHPQQSRLLDASVTFTKATVRSGTEALVTGAVRGGGTTLWFVTTTEILPVPLDDTWSLGDFDPDDVVIANGRALVSDGDRVFVGDLSYLAKRARDEAVLMPNPSPLPANNQTPAADVALPTGRETEPVVVNNGSSLVATPTASPPQPQVASPAVPQTTVAPAAPQPAPTAPPEPTVNTTQSEPVCTSTVDGGAITTTCRAPGS